MKSDAMTVFEQFDGLETGCSVRWETQTRYYWVKLHQDLLGDWVVSGCYGGRFNRLGQSFCHRVHDHKEGLVRISAIERKRLRHGYSRVIIRDEHTLTRPISSA